MRANFDSKAFEPIWKAIGEPGRKPGWGVKAKMLHDRGVDPYAVWVKGCRERRVSPWISMRMNDVHNVHDPSFCSLSTFWLKHPEFRREPGATVRNGGQWTCWALDYSHPEVRAYSLAFVKELLERYDFQHPTTGTVWKTVLTRGLSPSVVRGSPKSIPEDVRRECAWAFK